jgi:type VI protein secretion system component Hcp
MANRGGLKKLVGMGAVLGALLVAPATAYAGLFAIDAHVDGVTGGGNYTPTSFRWSAPFQVSFTHTTDNSTVDLMQLAQSHQVVGTATLNLTLLGTANITLQLSGVRIENVQEDGSSDGPAETVVLSFNEVTYTFQPLLPNGQKNGPPVTFTRKR